METERESAKTRYLTSSWIVVKFFHSSLSLTLSGIFHRHLIVPIHISLWSMAMVTGTIDRSQLKNGLQKSEQS